MERTDSRRRKVVLVETDASQDATTPRDAFTASKSEPGASPVPSVRFGLGSIIFAALSFALLVVFLLNPFKSISLLQKGHHIAVEEQFEYGISTRLHPEDHVNRSAKTLNFDWKVTKGFRSPDGVRKEVYLINDQFPGPLVETRSGDRIIVNVTNLLVNEGLAIHWHGLRMRGANDMDGAVGLTQKPIATGESFLYNFTIGDDESGTFWYHGHEKTQRDDGLYGGFIVHRPSDQCDESKVFDYDQEILLLVGDWYHRPSTEVLRWYMNSRSFGNEPVPDSLLVNGMGNFDCGMAVPARPVECTPPGERADMALLRVKRGKRYRLRLVNTGSLTGFSVNIDRASLAPFQVDGGNNITVAEAQGIGIIYPGERVDAILLVGSTNSQRYLTIEMDDENFKYPNPALNPSQAFPVVAAPSSDGEIRFVSPELEYYNLQAALSPHNLLPAPKTDPVKFVIYTTTMKLARHHNIPMGFINHTSWSPQSQPLISIPRTEYDQNQLSPHIPLASGDSALSDSSDGWVEITINNLDDGGHPFHLHGYSFYVVSVYPRPIPWSSEKPPFTPGGTAMYNYNPFRTLPAESPAGAHNLENPMLKDTVFVPQRGYAVVRFQADNAGIWMMHCHVGWHLGSGMAMSWDVS